MGIENDDLDMLTEEERAGMADDDGDEGDGAAADDGADGNDDGDDQDDGAGDAGDAADGKLGAADDGAADAGAEGRDDGKSDDDEDDTPVASAGPAERVDPVEAKAKIADIDTQKAALADKLDDGEMTTKEYTAAIDKLNDDKNQLTNTLARQQDHDEGVAKAWYADVGKFLDKNPELNANDTRLKSFDEVVRRVTSDPDNATLSNRKQLEKARDIWRDEMGYTEQAKPKTGEAEPKPKPAKAKPVLPPTLHALPAAEVNDSDDGKYSYLDALMNANPIAFEDALAKLSEADQQEYLSR